MAAQKAKFKKMLHSLEKEKLRCELQLRRHQDLCLDRADVGEVTNCEGVEYRNHKCIDVKQVNYEVTSSMLSLEEHVEHCKTNHFIQQKQPQGPLNQIKI